MENIRNRYSTIIDDRDAQIRALRKQLETKVENTPKERNEASRKLVSPFNNWDSEFYNFTESDHYSNFKQDMRQLLLNNWPRSQTHIPNYVALELVEVSSGGDITLTQKGRYYSKKITEES